RVSSTLPSPSVSSLLFTSFYRSHLQFHSFPTRRSSDLRTNNLICVDLICHGTPSPVVFADHIKMIEAKTHKHVISYCFRPKKWRSEEHTSELQSRFDIVCRLLLEKKNQANVDPNECDDR